MYEAFVPKEIFLTKGIGRHKEKLASFEEALRDAKIASFNLVPVSSIFPPGCKTVPVSTGLKELHPGQILHCVISRNTSNEYRRLISASVGLAIPKEGKRLTGTSRNITALAKRTNKPATMPKIWPRSCFLPPWVLNLITIPLGTRKKKSGK